MLSSILAISAVASLATAQVVDAKTKKTTTSSSTTVPTACSATVAVPSPTGIPCGKSGTLTGYPSYYGGGFGEVNRDACAAVCATLSGCNSFSYNQDSMICQLYGQTLKQQGFKGGKTPGDARQYYGLGCFGCAPMASSITTSSSSVIAPTTTSSTFVTSTITSTTSSVTDTTTSTSDTSVPTSTTSSIVSPTTSSATGTITAAPSPACTSPTAYTFTVTTTSKVYTDIYTSYFSGFQVTENPTNPGNSTSTNPKYKTVVTVLTDSDDCSAVADCADITSGITSGFFKSFDVYYDASIGSWMCDSFNNKQTDNSYFNVQNVTIGNSYGFST